MKKYLLPILITITALAVSASAAFYSVNGLMKLFAGAAFAVAIMASSLEVAKLVIATILHQYWTTLSRTLKIYLSAAVGILMLITSLGIYGFLSSAYQETAGTDKITEQQLAALEDKRNLFENNKQQLEAEKNSLVASTEALRQALTTGLQNKYVDKNGNEVIYTNTGNRKLFEQQLQQTQETIVNLDIKLQTANDSIFSIQTQIIQKQTQAASASELGPLKYLAKVTNTSMDSVVNWFLLLLVFVFDPLAISLVVTANIAFSKIKEEEPEQLELEDWIEDWSSNDIFPEDLEDIEWEEEQSNEALQKAAELYKDKTLQSEEDVEKEPYEMYVAPATASLEQQVKHTDWEIEAEPIEEEAEVVEPAPQTVSAEVQTLLNKIDRVKKSPNLTSWKKRQTIAELQKQIKNLDSNTKTYW